MHWVYDLGKAIAQSVVRSACHPCSLASRGKQIIPALLTVISTIVFVPVLSFFTTSPSCLCTSARLLFLYITLGLFCLSSVLLRDLRVPLSFRFAMTTAPPPNAQGLRAEKLVSLPSLACSLSSLPNATSMDGISLHHSMYAQRAAESEAKVTLSRFLPWYGVLMQRRVFLPLRNGMYFSSSKRSCQRPLHHNRTPHPHHPSLVT